MEVREMQGIENVATEMSLMLVAAKQMARRCDLANYLARFGELFGKIKQSRAGAIGGQLLSDPG
jgi:hypothetical protein